MSMRGEAVQTVYAVFDRVPVKCVSVYLVNANQCNVKRPMLDVSTLEDLRHVYECFIQIVHIV